MTQAKQRIAIIGNPNCGKTTIFNALTGLNQKVGNWSGVTVDKKTGMVTLPKQTVELIDLPGVYSLTAYDDNSLDEKIACQFLLEESPDAVINVLDASNLERNLYLTMQLLEMNIPVILAVNMIDTARGKGLSIDYEQLQKQLGCPVIPVIGRKKTGVDTLKKALSTSIQPCHFDFTYFYDPSIQHLANDLKHQFPTYPAYWLACALTENHCLLPQLLEASNYHKAMTMMQQQIGSDQPLVMIASQRYQAIHFLTEKTVTRQSVSRHRLTEWLDKLCMNRYLGIPIFLFVMYLMFQFSITIGGALQPLFETTSDVLFIQGTMHLGLWLGLPEFVITLVAQGIGLGLNTVLAFIPQIGCMFLFLSFLEDSGYMARAAFVMDRFMQAIGLPGKAFVPLIVGFGCNVPAIMATRTLETRRDRIMTIMMAPFMSCGARLAIFSVFGAAFFPIHGAFVIFLLYLAGIVGAILTGYLIKFIFLRQATAPFIMELPVYHWPDFKSVFLYTWQRLKGFLIRAGKIIIPVCVIIGSLNSIEWNGKIVAGGSQQSVLSSMGRIATPVFHPIGIEQDNWPATVGLMTGTLAKEVVVGTLNTLYTQQQPENLSAIANQEFHLGQKLYGAWQETIDGFRSFNVDTLINPFAANEADTDMDQTAMGTMVHSFGTLSAAFAYMLFVLLYIPCVSVIGTTAREASKGWAWLSVIWSLAMAYTGAVWAYQIAHLTTTPIYSVSWIIGTSLFIIGLIFVMKKLSHHLNFQPSLPGGGCGKKGCGPSGCH